MRDKDYRNKIKTVRQLLHLTQQDMADQLGYNDAKQYGRVETGDRKLGLELLESIAEVFGMSLVNLLDFDVEAALGHGAGAAETIGHARHEDVHEALALAYERIKHLEGEVAFLRQQLERQ